jgi:hypothetical protein
MDTLEEARQAQPDERYEDAHSLIIECLESAASLDDRERLANALLLLADNLLYCCPEGEDRFAYRKFAAEQALNFFRELDDRRGEARALLTLASVADDGLNQADASLAITRELDDQETIVKAMCWIANHQSIAGKESCDFTEAIRLARETRSAELLFMALFVQGVINESDCLATFSELASLKPAPVWKRKFVRRLNAAASLISQDHADRAEVWWNECLPIAREIGDVSLEGSILLGLSGIVRSRGESAKADDMEAVGKVMLGPIPDFSDFIQAADTKHLPAAMAALQAIVNGAS